MAKAVRKKKGEPVPPALLNTIQKQQLISEIHEWLMDGRTSSDICDLIARHAPDGIVLSPAYCKGLLVQARQILEDESKQTASAVIAVHISMYEEIFAYGHEVEAAPLVNKALKQKEKLLGLHKEENSLTVNNKKKLTVIRKEPEYDVKKLSKKEQDRFEELLKKANG